MELRFSKRWQATTLPSDTVVSSESITETDSCLTLREILFNYTGQVDKDQMRKTWLPEIDGEQLEAMDMPAMRESFGSDFGDDLLDQLDSNTSELLRYEQNMEEYRKNPLGKAAPVRPTGASVDLPSDGEQRSSTPPQDE